jgi:fatty-acyl-CoA synthase
MNLANIIRYWSKRDPQRTTFFLPDREVSWAEMDDRTSRLAQGLIGLGVESGDRVGVLMPNCIEFCETVLAALKCGAVTVPLNFRLAPREVQEIMRRSGTKVLVAEGRLAATLARTPGGDDPLIVVVHPTTGGELEFENLVSLGEPTDPDVQVQPEHPAFICFTSGTTGLPKGAVLSHRNVMATAMERMVCDHWNASDVGFIPYAIAFTGGLVSMWMPLYVSGAQVVLEPTFDPERALDLIARRRVTAFIAVASVWEAMAASPGFEAADLSSLTTAATGGMYISDHLVRALGAKGVRLAQQYGLTEGGGLNIILPADQALTRVGSAGLPTPQCAARIEAEDGSACAPGEVGELLLQGPQLMERYWDDEQATAEAVVDGWLHTGDLASIDADGYIRIVDRKKDMLISGGVNVYPAEIERILAEIPELSEATVIGVPDAKWGEVPAVIARTESEFSPEQLLAYCRGQLASYKVPKHVIFRKEPLPRSMSGKVMKAQLRQEYDSVWTTGAHDSPNREE